MDKLPEQVLVILKQLPFTWLSIGFKQIFLYSEQDAIEGQKGYRQGFSDDALFSAFEGDWNPNWYVIGKDELNSAFLIDIRKNEPEIVLALSGYDEWHHINVASNISNFIRILKWIEKISQGRENEELLEKNPIPDLVRNQVLLQIKKENPNSDISYWEEFLENYDD